MNLPNGNLRFYIANSLCGHICDTFKNPTQAAQEDYVYMILYTKDGGHVILNFILYM